MSVATPYFDQLFAENDDPWAFRQRWYERRKRALTLAVLTRPRYAAIFEPGCANGELSFELAPRCDRLLCCDTAAAAVSLARSRLLGFPHAEVQQSRLPEQWPTERFELIARGIADNLQQAQATGSSTASALSGRKLGTITGSPGCRAAA